MTTQHERRLAVHKLLRLSRAMLDPKRTPRLPKAIRELLYLATRHAPSEDEFDLFFSDRTPARGELARRDIP